VARLSCGVRRMSKDDARSEYAAIAALGRKIGFPKLAMQDFDLIFANPNSVDRFCDQLESVELTSQERFHFMQIIVASLDMALSKSVPSARADEERVEYLISKDIKGYEYIIEYWIGAEGGGFHVTAMMQRLRGQANEGA